MMIEGGLHTIPELFVLLEEYHNTHPEQDPREGVVCSESPANAYYLGAVDFLQWLANGQEFLYEPETHEDIDSEDWNFLASMGAVDQVKEHIGQVDETLDEWFKMFKAPVGVLLPLIEEPLLEMLDQEEEENLERDGTY